MGWLSWLSTGIRVAGAVVSSLGGANTVGGKMMLKAGETKETYLGNLKIRKVTEDGKTIAYLFNDDKNNGYYLSFTSSDPTGSGNIKNLFVPAAKDGVEVKVDVTDYFLDNLAGAICYSSVPYENGEPVAETDVSFSIKNWSKQRLNFCGNDFGIAINYEENMFFLTSQLSKGTFKDIKIQTITQSGDVYNISTDKLAAGDNKTVKYPETMDNVTPIARVTVSLTAPIEAIIDDTHPTLAYLTS
ncbi:hypothetical protein ACN5ZZ_004647 [Vibrio parahaemolyticus]